MSNKPICQKCLYHRKTTGTCDYFLIEKEERGCKPTDNHCDKFVEKEKRHRNGGVNDIAKFNKYMDAHCQRLSQKEYSLRKNLYHFR